MPPSLSIPHLFTRANPYRLTGSDDIKGGGNFLTDLQDKGCLASTEFFRVLSSEVSAPFGSFIRRAKSTSV